MEELLKVLLVSCSILEIYLCYCYVFLCWADRKELRWHDRLVIGAAVVILGLLTARQKNYFLFSYTITVVQAAAISLTTFFLPKKKKIIGCTVATLYVAMVALLDDLLAFAVLQVMKEAFPVAVYFPLSSYKLSILLCSRALVGVLYFVMRRWAPQIRETIQEYWHLLAGIGLGAMILAGIYDAIFMEAMRSASAMQNAGVIAALLMIIVLILAVGSILLKSMSVRKEQESVQLREEMLEAHYRQILELMEENRESMHDMKHHLHILKEYAGEMEIEKIQVYLQELQEPVMELEKVIWTKSQILNLILNQKMREAAKNEIEMRIEVEPAFRLDLKDTEICSVFSNLLDNALEASADAGPDRKWIDVKLRNQGEMRSIQIANGISRAPVVRNGELVTTKGKGTLHGLGMKSVVRIVKRHGGDMRFQIEDGVFRVNIIFF